MLSTFHRPNTAFAQTTPGDNSAYHLLTLPTDISPFGARTTVQCVTSAGTATGGTFQLLVNQTAAPGNSAAGELYTGTAPYVYEGLPTNIYVKLTTATDLINVLVEY